MKKMYVTAAMAAAERFQQIERTVERLHGRRFRHNVSSQYFPYRCFSNVK